MNKVRPHVIYVSYTGLAEPLGASQVLPYIHSLSDDWRFTVVSFEKGSAARRTEDVATEIRNDGNRWIALRYHRGAGLFSKAVDLLLGARVVRRLARTDPPALVHARGYVPAAIASTGSPRSVPLLFDIRGLQAEESVEGQAWRTGGVRYRLTKRAEHYLFRRADGVVTLTNAIIPYLRSQPGLAERDIPWAVIPCCVDISHFTFDPTARSILRERIGATPDDLVFAWIGSIGTWYAFEDAARIAAALSGRLLVLSTESPVVVRRLVTASGLDEKRAFITAATRDEMPSYLSAADVALCLVRPSFSKLASSPTKVAEALSVGVPVWTYDGIGDLPALARQGHRGAIVTIRPDEYEPPVAPTEESRRICRSLAEDQFSLSLGREKYHRLYTRLASHNAPQPGVT